MNAVADMPGGGAPPSDNDGASPFGAIPPSFERVLPLRARETLQRIAVRTKTIRVMRLVLPAIAILLIGLVVLWPYLTPERSGFQIGFADVEDSVESMSMIDARFVGTDENNLPFTVSAERVDNLVPGATEMVLRSPAADMTLEDGSWVMVRSKTGEYKVEAKSLDLVGDVEMFHDGGYEFRTSRASVDLGRGVITGSEPVAGHGPFGEVTAEGFQVKDEGRSIVFQGQSRLFIYPGAMRSQQ